MGFKDKVEGFGYTQCPKCGSKKIDYYPATVGASAGFMFCKDCDFEWDKTFHKSFKR